jgi:hypothetical protein
MNAAPDPHWQPDPQLLAAYFDGELDGRDGVADVRARIEAWLEAHPEAMAEWTKHRQLDKIWGATTPAQPNADAWDRTLARIDEGRRKQPAPARSANRGWLGVALLLTGVAAVAVGLLLGTLFPRAGTQVVSPKNQDAVEVFAVATSDEITILRVEGADTASLVIGEPPLSGPIELAEYGEIRVVHLRPDARDSMIPNVRQQGPHRPMIWAPTE